jgi:CheY-like chemotaxis protein
MLPGQTQKLFSAFSQTDASITRQYGGVGLGLTLTRSLVGLMGGKISLESEFGVGTNIMFTCVFGLDPSTKDAVKLTVDSSSAGINVEKQKMVSVSLPHEEQSLAGYRVLLVEDNKVNVMVAKALLEKMELDVTVAENGEVALERLGVLGKSGSDQVYDLVFLDIQMPVMDGFETIKQIRANPRYASMPVVALTAHAFAEEIQRCFDSGMNGHLAKPIDIHALQKVLRQFLQQSTKPA